MMSTHTSDGIGLNENYASAQRSTVADVRQGRTTVCLRDGQSQRLYLACNVDLHGVPADQQQAVETQLLEILSLGLQGVGKTKSSAEMDVRPQGSIKPLHTGQVLPREGLWIITLQTPALICDPARLDESSGHRELHQAYASAWTELSGSSIILVRFFAEQSLAGGYYLHQRFQSGKPYNPYVLTEPGSVFVLTAVPGQEVRAQECVDNWFERGLPLPDWAVHRYERDGVGGANWNNCPYIRENGYGEITVNLNFHWEKRLQEN